MRMVGFEDDHSENGECDVKRLPLKVKQFQSGLTLRTFWKTESQVLPFANGEDYIASLMFNLVQTLAEVPP